MKIALITGSAGFIGTNLSRELLSLGYRVVGLDNFSSGFQENVALLKDIPNFSFVKHDVRKPIKINGHLDEIYNMACPASRKTTRRDPIYTLETCILGVKNVLELAKKNKAKVLHASSSEVYGDPLENPQKEDYRGNVNPIGPRGCYDEGKRAAETLCYEYFKQGVNVRVVRLFNAYGPFMGDDGRVIISFIKQALRNDDLTVFGDGSQTRSFCFIEDTINGLLKFMKLRRRYFGPLNLGNPESLPIIKLAKKVLKSVPQSKSKIVFKSLPENDPLKRQPDISLAIKVLKWKPRISLDEGIEKTIEYWLERKIHLRE
jgi:UDP-glucuronate decarboxylase